MENYLQWTREGIPLIRPLIHDIGAPILCSHHPLEHQLVGVRPDDEDVVHGGDAEYLTR